MQTGYNPAIILTAFSENWEKTRSHGIGNEIIEAQAETLGMLLERINTSWNDYESKFIQKLSSISRKHEIGTAVFGDIDIEEHKDWEEKVCRKSNVNSFLPLWQTKRIDILNEFLKLGFKAKIVAVNNNKMSPDYLGKELTIELIDNMLKDGIDACGENGEYHTLVFDGPLFSYPLKLKEKEKYFNSHYSFIEMTLNST